MKSQSSVRLMLTGARRGLGKTTISVNLALNYAQMGLKVLLIEEAHSGISEPAYQERLKEFGIRYFHFSPDSKSAFNLEGGEAEVILFDSWLSPSFSRWENLRQFQVLLIVSLPGFYSLIESYALMKLLYLNLSDCQLALAINRVRQKEDFFGSIKILKELSEKYMARDFVWLGTIPEYQWDKQTNKNLPLFIKSPANKFSKRISGLGRELLGLCLDCAKTFNPKEVAL